MVQFDHQKYLGKDAIDDITERTENEHPKVHRQFIPGLIWMDLLAAAGRKLEQDCLLIQTFSQTGIVIEGFLTGVMESHLARCPECRKVLGITRTCRILRRSPTGMFTMLNVHPLVTTPSHPD